MIRAIGVLILTCILLSCNNTDKSNNSVEAPMEKETATDSISTTPPQFVAIDTEEALIATALMAAPKASRDNCKVIGYNMEGDFVTLKEGDNEFIVLADNPKKDGFSAACYHKDLEPFMARGRALKAEGKNSAEIFDIREEEAKSGVLDMGAPGSTLHIYYSSNDLYNPETFEVKDAQYRYVVYLPFATSESTGLPEKPIGSNHPWIMDPGTHKAHIMISPLPDSKE
ncbi:hypothetical protein MG296_06690 [Flavobacteriaceae bacterium TK19130]|nr:hypothetical protein [Thermobacterium salinum]